MNTMQDAYVTMSGIRKAYPDVLALDNVNLHLYPGEVHGLMGENGAGKSTLIKILTGALEKDSGEILFEGSLLTINSTKEFQKIGISTVYQEVNLIPTMSVVENLNLGETTVPFGFISWSKARTLARTKLARLNIDIDLEQPLGSYSVAIQHLIAIAKALNDNTKLLVLDEPTASLDKKETATLFKIIRNLTFKGIGIVFITHFLDQVYEISDRISVLWNGKNVMV